MINGGDIRPMRYLISGVDGRVYRRSRFVAIRKTYCIFLYHIRSKYNIAWGEGAGRYFINELYISVDEGRRRRNYSWSKLLSIVYFTVTLSIQLVNGWHIIALRVTLMSESLHLLHYIGVQ